MENRHYPKPEWLSKDAIRKEAEEFLAEFSDSSDVPVDIERIVDTNAGVDIVELDGIFAAYGIDGFLSSDTKTIYVDKYIAGGKPLNRYRFTLAHEIGHWYLHQELYEAAAYQNPEEFTRFRSGLGIDDVNWYEWQAREFAGLVLVPPAALRRKVDEAINEGKGRGLEPDLASEAYRDAVAEWVGRRLEVSADVIRFRDAADGLWKL